MTAGGCDDIVFRADSVRKTFGDRTVLNAATLWARRGRISALLGRNGCGKSTLFRVATGLLRADQGVIFFGGQVTTRPRLHRLGPAGLFFLPERGLMPRNRTVAQLLDAVARRYDGDTAPHVAALHLEPLLGHTADMLSGGERRRTELALALTRAPDCLLADEPFMGIAPCDSDILATALRRLSAAGCAIVASGHEVTALLDLADEVVWMTAGTTHSLGTPAEARNHWPFGREYLGICSGASSALRRGVTPRASADYPSATERPG
jgi:lipopolysaccharide export system ATP-binding protein